MKVSLNSFGGDVPVGIPQKSLLAAQYEAANSDAGKSGALLPGDDVSGANEDAVSVTDLLDAADDK
jgi:hypothetical protein